jgi:hypothetical protein
MVALPDYRTDTALYFSKSNGYVPGGETALLLIMAWFIIILTCTITVVKFFRREWLKNQPKPS